MKSPKKLSNAALALADDFRDRVQSASNQLSEDAIIDLAEWSSSLPNGRELFAGWCLALENGTVTASDLPGVGKFIPPVQSSSDARFTLLFDMLKAFILEDPNTFWGDSPVAQEAAPETSLPDLEIPSVEAEESIAHDEFQIEETEIPGVTQLDPFAFLNEPSVTETPVEAKTDNKVILTSELTPEESEKLFGHPPEKRIVRIGERMALKWNDQQSDAIKKVLDWYQNHTRVQQVFRLFGYAGVGKSSLINEISYVIQNGEGVKPGKILFATYTGKAAAVLRSKGMPASTIHSLIYRPEIDYLTGQITGFTLNDESELHEAALLVCDEVSMVNEEMGQDLLSFGVPILVVGDRGQLDPIKGEGFFMKREPDVELTKIERVALDNPLIWLANEVRMGNSLKPGSYGTSKVHRIKDKIPAEYIMEADQLICGMNRTRTSLNRRYRKLMGYFDQDSEFPVLGDRLMCLKNNKNTGVLNGTQWHCSTPTIEKIWKPADWRNPLGKKVETNAWGLHMRIRSCDLFDINGDPIIINTVCSTHHFDENAPEPHWKDVSGTDEFTFAYAATVHKAQGSQYPYVVIKDESDVFGDQAWKHRYTAISRASERVDIFID